MGIQWRESLAIGVPAIDNQHKELLLRFDKLLNASQAGQGVDELKRLQVYLDEYVHSHFSDEEALQRQHSYPGYEAHRGEHRHFIEQINKLRRETESAGVATHNVIETNNLLLKWLLNHISKVDTQLAAYINSKSA